MKTSDIKIRLIHPFYDEPLEEDKIKTAIPTLEDKRLYGEYDVTGAAVIPKENK